MVEELNPDDDKTTTLQEISSGQRDSTGKGIIKNLSE